MNLINAHAHLDFLDCNVKSIVNATQPSNWQNVKEICKKNSNFFPAFGLHPYFVTESYLTDKKWLSELELLLHQPQSSLGEVGLDKKTQTNLETQIQIFEIQLEIAQELKKVVNIHCFGAFDKLTPILKKRKLIYILHGYSGSYEITKDLLKMDNCFFSFGYIQQNRIAKIKQILEIIPNEKILIETDSRPNLSIQNVFFSITKIKNSITEQNLTQNLKQIFI